MINFINVKNQDFINACKALMTVILTLALVHNFASPLAIYFSLYTAACCAFMQAGETKKDQFFSMLLAGGAFIFFLAFGLFIKEYMLLANIALIIFAFATFYLPNLGLNYKIPPVLALVFYVLVIHMQTANSAFLPTVAANLVGVIVAIAIYFLFWPYEVKHELMLVSQTICHQYRTILERYYLLARRGLTVSRRRDQMQAIEETLDNVNKALIMYEKLNQGEALKKEEADYFDKLYLRLYIFLQITKMMAERFPDTLSAESHSILQHLYKDLILQTKEVEYRFDKMVPHSMIAKNLIGRSLNLGKSLTLPLLRVQTKPKKHSLTEQEFNKFLEELITLDQSERVKQVAFAILRMHEFLTYITDYQESAHFNLKQGMFL